MGQTLIEKIVQKYSVGLAAGQTIYANDFVSLRPRHVMTHDNTGAVVPKFRSIGARQIFDPSQPVIALDHDVQNTSPENLAKYAAIEEFARTNKLAFYPARSGIAHQIMVEEGFVLPGTLVVGSDSHSNIYGAMAAVGTSVVRTDAAAIWATGETWWQVPEIVKVEFSGALRSGVTGKDVILALIGTYSHDEVLNAAIEFTGPGVASLSMDSRLTIANMTTEWGALVGLFPYDEVVRQYLLSRAAYFEGRGDHLPRITAATVADLDRQDLQPDADATYAKTIRFDLSQVQPGVSGPNEVKTWLPLGAFEQSPVKIDKAYLMSCVNGRLEDIKAAAEVIQGQQVAEGVKFYLAAASASVEAEARKLGYWQTLTEAGAIELPPGCGPCIGLGQGVLEPGEVGISATNRNFKGRMGSSQANVYLASPAVVAASAVAGHIAEPKIYDLPSHEDRRFTIYDWENPKPSENELLEAIQNPKSKIQNPPTSVIPDFPQTIVGELLFLPKDNMNTDGIYGKEFTYVDNIPPDEMATKAMLNYDPAFQDIAQAGDIVVGGWNFGTGSSREQAATALKYRGISLVVAGSFSQIFKRNAFNNGFIVLECPALLEILQSRFAANSDLTIRTGDTATFDFAAATITAFGQTFTFSPLGRVAQELIVAGGFEPMLEKKVRSA